MLDSLRRPGPQGILSHIDVAATFFASAPVLYQKRYPVSSAFFCACSTHSIPSLHNLALAFAAPSTSAPTDAYCATFSSPFASARHSANSFCSLYFLEQRLAGGFVKSKLLGNLVCRRIAFCNNSHHVRHDRRAKGAL